MPTTHYQLSKLQSVDRITRLPIVETGWYYAGKVYSKIKTSNSVVHWAIDQAETTIFNVVDSALPAAVLFEGPLQTVDTVLCKSLDIVEERYPSVKLPPEVMYVNAKQYVTNMGKTFAQPVLKRADSMKQIGNTVLVSKYTEFAAETLDGALDVADKYVERYLPGDGSDDSKISADDVEAVKAIKTLHHVDRFSRKLQRRLTRRALAEAEAIKEQSTEAIHVLLYVTELIATDPALALEKGKELWASLSQDEPENQAPPENLEQLIVMVTRETARRAVHLVNFTFEELNKLPLLVSTTAQKIFAKNGEAAGSLVKIFHLENVNEFVLESAQLGIKQAAIVFSYFVNILEQWAKLLSNLESSNKRYLQETKHQNQPNTSNFDTLKPPTPKSQQLRASAVVNGID
ncbi:lipid storage droplets surface-binding protein 1 isoform X2 [Agrilus planipennis]|uniref:Lipid storage droplets surface-binding protein 1 isoform X2 n=1 Tax=Agrilus planipennis TaxID=224129 RepID=A0A1W4WB95_AGRPL|nr:lipid storage droplets surface-binding protein 1 isoform X2 [Agrilus planipennis]